MRKFLILIVPILMSCHKEQAPSHPPGYDIDTRVFVSLKDHNGNDLLKNIIDLDEIELESIGERGNEPLPYKVDPTINVVSSEFYFYRPANEKNDLSSLEIYFPYTYPTSTTIIRWNNDLTTDSLHGEVVYDKKRNIVRLDKLSLNGKSVWTDQDRKDRFIVIEKNVSK